MGFYEPQAGRISIDGHDLKSVNLQALRPMAKGGFLADLIAIIATIIMPNAQGMQIKAKRAKTRAQLNQWAVAMELFKAEYGAYPQVDDTYAGGGGGHCGHRAPGTDTGGAHHADLGILLVLGVVSAALGGGPAALGGGGQRDRQRSLRPHARVPPTQR